MGRVWSNCRHACNSDSLRLSSVSSVVSTGATASTARIPLPGALIILVARYPRVATGSDNRLVFRIHPMAGVKALHAGDSVCTAMIVFLSLQVGLR